MTVTYTHPDVLNRGVTEGWADPTQDPTTINWASRQAAAAIPFRVVNGRPINPCERTNIRYGRNQLGHWGEALAADAMVTLTDATGHRWILLIERSDGHGWALPGGHVDPGETPARAAARELTEETGLHLSDDTPWHTRPPRYVPDPRASDEAWMVTVLAATHLPDTPTPGRFPEVHGATDATDAAWIPADTYQDLTTNITGRGGQVFTAHQTMLTEELNRDHP